MYGQQVEADQHCRSFRRDVSPSLQSCRSSAKSMESKYDYGISAVLINGGRHDGDVDLLSVKESFRNL